MSRNIEIETKQLAVGNGRESARKDQHPFLAPASNYLPSTTSGRLCLCPTARLSAPPTLFPASTALQTQLSLCGGRLSASLLRHTAPYQEVPAAIPRFDHRSPHSNHHPLCQDRQLRDFVPPPAQAPSLVETGYGYGTCLCVWSHNP